MFRLRIKGTLKDAEAVLDARGFNPADRFALHGSPILGEVIAVVSATCEPGLLRWYTDSVSGTAPLPPGTLLFYAPTEVCEYRGELCTEAEIRKFGRMFERMIEKLERSVRGEL